MEHETGQVGAVVPSVGDWVVCHSRAYSWLGEYGAAQVKRVTAKMVFANANHRTQFPHDDVIVMPDEATARLLCERIESAKAEAEHRIRNAKDAARGKIAALLLAQDTPKTGGSHDSHD